jgi:hypothetical protein
MGRDSPWVVRPVVYRGIAWACLFWLIGLANIGLGVYLAVAGDLWGVAFGAMFALGGVVGIWRFCRWLCFTATYDDGRLRFRRLIRTEHVRLADIDAVIGNDEDDETQPVFRIRYPGGAALVVGRRGERFVGAIADTDPRLKAQHRRRGQRRRRPRHTTGDDRPQDAAPR